MRSTISRLGGRRPSRFPLFRAYCKRRFDPLDNRGPDRISETRPTIPSLIDPASNLAFDHSEAAVPITR